MAGAIRSSREEPQPVWPYAHGRVRGQAIEPLHPAAPERADDWAELGELLGLLDSLRAGDARVRKVAGDLLSERLRSWLRSLTDERASARDGGPGPRLTATTVSAISAHCRGQELGQGAPQIPADLSRSRIRRKPL